jgi:prevent-host-death family protein
LQTRDSFQCRRTGTAAPRRAVCTAARPLVYTTSPRGTSRLAASDRLAKLLAMQVNMHEAKTRLSELVAAAERGEEVLIARHGTPAVRLVAVTREHAPVRLGVLAGQIEVGDDFDEPLPEFEPYAR